LYTSDLPLPPEGVSITTYADDMTPAASHSNYHTAEDRLQPYLNDIFNWIKKNNLTLNPDKSTTTLFTPDTHEHNMALNLSIINITIPIVKEPKIFGLTFDTTFNFGTHVNQWKSRLQKTSGKADSTVKILKALTRLSCLSLNTPAQSGHRRYLQPIYKSYNPR